LSKKNKVKRKIKHLQDSSTNGVSITIFSRT